MLVVWGVSACLLGGGIGEDGLLGLSLLERGTEGGALTMGRRDCVTVAGWRGSPVAMCYECLPGRFGFG